MQLEAMIFRILCAKNYNDRFKLLRVTEENPAYIFETRGIKRSFHRAANAIIGKIGRLASEEVTLQLIVSKCMPMLLYDLEACTLYKSQLSPFDFNQ